MITGIARTRPWRRTLSRTVSFLDRRHKRSQEQKDYQFKDLGVSHIKRPLGRCLVAFMPEFIGYLYRHPEVGPRGWDAKTLDGKIQKFATQFGNHQMFWDSAEMVRQIISRGFIVDYVSSRHGHLVEDVHKYDVIIDEWTSLPSWAKLNPSAKKLFYATGAHWIFHNKAEMTRHEWLFRRRGVELASNRQVPHLLSDGYADIITTFGNREVNATFGSNSHKIRKLCTTAVADDIQLQAKNWAESRQSFLFFASSPWWHKGLDLVVEAFVREPTLHLHIITAGVDAESDFWQVYGRDIDQSGNISVHGFLSVLSEEFNRLVDSCVAIVVPSASEGCAGSVVQAMHYGLIPIVTPIVGLELDEHWPALAGESDIELIKEIRARCRQLAEMHERELDELREYFWRHARANHTRAVYRQLFSNVLNELLDGKNDG